jgi:hypothetical protein
MRRRWLTAWTVRLRQYGWTKWKNTSNNNFFVFVSTKQSC